MQNFIRVEAIVRNEYNGLGFVKKKKGAILWKLQESVHLLHASICDSKEIYIKWIKVKIASEQNLFSQFK